MYIFFDFNGKNIHLYVDPNDDVVCDYKYIKAECLKLNIPFKNQSFTQMITQLKKRYYDNINIRHTFTSKERVELWKLSNNKCQCCNKKVKSDNFEIDHIKPLSIGGTNDIDNLQILCKACHKIKTSGEQEQGYFKLSDTESSFNSITKEIFDSSLCASYAFIEPINKDVPKRFKSYKIYNIDINKCRKNQLYYGQSAFPLFTVMDKPVMYNGQTQSGLYYVETSQYFPFRGFGWYYYPLIKYGLENNLISESDIKYVIISSLEVPANYYNDFIDYLYSNVEEAKLSVNAMIGNFKPKPREQWKSELISDNSSEAFYWYLKLKGSFIDVRNINGKNYYQIYSSSTITRQETESPIYNQILELEAIELHRLKMLIESKGGYCLDLNTDCISCVFKKDILPFEMIDDTINLKGYYYDNEGLIPKYKLEFKDKRLECPKMENYKRILKYEIREQDWTIQNDIQSNDFKILVDQILDSKKSINIDGRAGTGKSTLINMLQAEMKLRGISFKTLAPTNKAARVIHGQTIHKFLLANSSRKVMDCFKYDYIFVDEISMIHELFYKFFITLKRVRPELKFIIAGDFLQLLPVNDRLDCDYKTSPALYELCDGQRLQLAKCRRANDLLFKLTDPINIPNLKKSDFNKADPNKLYTTNLCFTNDTRKKVNTIMMDRFINIKIQETNQESLKKLASKKSPIPLPVPIILKALEKDEIGQDVKLMKGMPIIARKTTDKYDIMNNEIFNIFDIDEDTFTIILADNSKIEIDIKEFQQLFNIAFCMTIHKSQGQTINHNYNIYEWSKLDDRLKYVALSRSTDIKHIHIN